MPRKCGIICYPLKLENIQLEAACIVTGLPIFTKLISTLNYRRSEVGTETKLKGDEESSLCFIHKKKIHHADRLLL